MYITNEGSLYCQTYFYHLQLIRILMRQNRMDAKPFAYDFANLDEKWAQVPQLYEISGMAWIPGKDMMLAENDEKGKGRLPWILKQEWSCGRGEVWRQGWLCPISCTMMRWSICSSGTGSVIKVTSEGGETKTQQFDLPEKGNNEFGNAVPG